MNLREELIELLKAGRKTFPILRDRKARPYPTEIPWSVAELAYSVYSSRYGNSQSLQTLANRGGFHPGEMDDFLPDWRERCDENAALRAEKDSIFKTLMAREQEIGRLQSHIARLEKANQVMRDGLEFYGDPNRWFKDKTQSSAQSIGGDTMDDVGCDTLKCGGRARTALTQARQIMEQTDGQG